MIEVVLDRFLVGSTDHHECHTVTRGLTDNGRVSITVEKLFELIVDLVVVGGNADQAETETNTVLNGLVLSTVSETVFQIVDCFQGVLVMVDQTIGKVSTSGGVWGVGLVWHTGTGKVWIQDGKSVLTVASMNETERSCCVEPVPVLGLGHPAKVILQERVICRVCVLNGIGPDSGSMKNRTLWSNLFLNSLDDLDISVVVLLQELIVESLPYLTFKDGQDLLESLKSVTLAFSLLVYWELLHEALDDLALIGLVLLIADVKGNLVSIQIFFITLGKFFHQ